MKSIYAFIAISLVALSVQAKELVCTDATSRLVLKTPGVYDKIEGDYHYNKTPEGEYGSLAVLGCKSLPLDDNWDLLDCTETTYSVHYSLYQVPKDVFKRTDKNPFTVTELSRDEVHGDIIGSSTFEKCLVR